MCEFLIRSVDNHCTTRPEEDPFCWKAGDVVWVAEDGTQWGKSETKENGFYVVRFEGMSVADGRAYLEENEPKEGWAEVFNSKSTVTALGEGRTRYKMPMRGWVDKNGVIRQGMERRSQGRQDTVEAAGFIRRPAADLIPLVRETR